MNSQTFSGSEPWNSLKCYTRTLYIFEDANTTAIDVLEKCSGQESFCGSIGKSESLYTMHVSPSVVLAFEEPPSTLNTLVDDVQCRLSVAVRWIYPS